MRADAIRVGVKKHSEGCFSCGESYFDLARRHGASEREIELAKKAGIKSDPSFEVLNREDQWPRETLQYTRREVLKVAASGAIGVAATMGRIDVAGVAAAETAPIDAAGVAWILGTQPLPFAEHYLIGVSADGSLVGSQPAVPARLLRTADGKRLCSVESIRQGAQVVTAVTIYSAASGSVEATIGGRAIGVTAVGDFDYVTGSLAPGDRYLAVFHQTLRGFTPAPPPPTPPAVAKPPANFSETIVADSVEMFDLQSQRTVADLELGASAASRMASQVEWTPDGTSLYVITSDSHFRESITALDFDGAQLRRRNHATDGIGGHTIPRSELPVPSAARILDRRTLMRYMPGEVHWLDLDQLTLRDRIQLGEGANLNGAKAFAAVPVFSADSTTLYLANPMTGFVSAIDLAARLVTRAAFLPQEGTEINRSLGDIAQDAIALSADGSRLYVLDGRNAARRLWTLSLPGLGIITHSSHGEVSALWTSSSGSLFSLNASARVVGIHDRDGNLVSSLSLPVRPHAFLQAGRRSGW